MLNLALAVLTGILLVIIHPRLDWWFLSPFAIAPLLVALAREWRPKYRFLLGYVSGLVFWAGICYWIQFVMDVHGGLGPWFAGLLFAVFCVIKALNFGVFGLCGALLIRSRYAVLAVAALWVVLERIPDPFGFMWLHLGNAGIDNPLLIRIAPVLGVWGISFLLAAFSTAVALLVLRRPKIELAPVAILGVCAFLPALPAPQNGSEVAVSVQPNVDETETWTWPMVERLDRALEVLSLEPAVGIRPKLVLWPEVPAPIYYYDDPPLRGLVARVAAGTRAHVLIGTVARNTAGAPLNAALMVGPDGQAIGRYDKMFLVPFGEYVPFPFGVIAGKVTSEIGDFAPGERVVTFALGGGEKVGAFICYESAFPGLVRDFVTDGATVLANLSNDGYFGHSAAREQHLSLVRMRAVENRRWILRSTNNGITAAVDPGGRSVRRFPEFEQLSGRLPFSYVHDWTPFTRWGGWFPWACGLASLVALAASQWPNYMSEAIRPPRRPAPVKRKTRR